jgi:putative ABC transport system permease protein
VKYAPLVWAALWRKPAEALLTWLAIVAAFTLFGLMGGLTNAVDALIESGRTDLLYVEPRFPGTADGFPIAVREELTRFEGVTAVASVYGVGGFHTDVYGKRTRLYVQLFDEAGPSAAKFIPFSAAEWQRLLATPAGLFVSGKAAKRFGLKPGDRFTLSTAPGERADGGLGWTFDVLGIVDEMPGWANGYLVGNFRFVDQAKPRDKQGFVYRFIVALADPARAQAILHTIDRHFMSSATPTRSMTARSRAQNDATGNGGAITSKAPIVAGAGLFMILLLIANGVAQSVRERIPEFAVLTTLGYANRTITMLIFAEAAIPCVIGAALGTLLAAEVARVPMRFLAQGLDSLPPPVIVTGSLGHALACAVLLAAVSAVVPVFRLRRLSVVDGLAGR